jgi:hypothetical protein
MKLSKLIQELNMADNWPQPNHNLSFYYILHYFFFDVILFYILCRSQINFKHTIMLIIYKPLSDVPKRSRKSWAPSMFPKEQQNDESSQPHVSTLRL